MYCNQYRHIGRHPVPTSTFSNNTFSKPKHSQEMTTGESSAVKIALVEAAEQELGGRFTVVCSQGAFSFVTSTTSYCLHSQAGLNCYLFKTQ